MAGNRIRACSASRAANARRQIGERPEYVPVDAPVVELQVGEEQLLHELPVRRPPPPLSRHHLLHRQPEVLVRLVREPHHRLPAALRRRLRQPRLLHQRARCADRHEKPLRRLHRARRRQRQPRRHVRGPRDIVAPTDIVVAAMAAGVFFFVPVVVTPTAAAATEKRGEILEEVTVDIGEVYGGRCSSGGGVSAVGERGAFDEPVARR